MASSLAPATIKQYAKPLREWINWCEGKGADPFNPEESAIIEFLTKMFEDRASYGTINSARSAISLISIDDTSNSKKLKRFMKGVFRLKPPKARYEKTWDIKPVLDKLSSWKPTEALDLSQLTNKLVLLLAIVSLQRLQTLSGIKLSNMSKTEFGYEVKIPDLLKTSGPGRAQPLISLPYHEREELCIATILECYLKKTKELRGSIENLSITTKKPHKAASTATLSRWIRATLVDCGVGTEYGAHSTRHASTSAALKKGVSLEVIKNVAGWSKESTVFFNYYNRPIEPAPVNYAAVLLK